MRWLRHQHSVTELLGVQAASEAALAGAPNLGGPTLACTRQSCRTINAAQVGKVSRICETGPCEANSGSKPLISPYSSAVNHTCQQQLRQGGLEWELHHVPTSCRQSPSIVQRTQHLQDGNMQAASGQTSCRVCLHIPILLPDFQHEVIAVVP